MIYYIGTEEKIVFTNRVEVKGKKKGSAENESGNKNSHFENCFPSKPSNCENLNLETVNMAIWRSHCN